MKILENQIKYVYTHRITKPSTNKPAKRNPRIYTNIHKYTQNIHITKTTDNTQKQL